MVGIATIQLRQRQVSVKKEGPLEIVELPIPKDVKMILVVRKGVPIFLRKLPCIAGMDTPDMSHSCTDARELLLRLINASDGVEFATTIIWINPPLRVPW